MSAPSATGHPARHANGRFGPGNPAPRAALIEPDGVPVNHASADPAPPRTASTVFNGETVPNHANADPAPSAHRIYGV